MIINYPFISALLLVIIISGCLFLTYRMYKKSNLQKKGKEAETDLFSSITGEQLEISKRELEMVFDAIPEQVFIIDDEYRIIRANKSFSVFAMEPIKELLGKKCHLLQWNSDTPCPECPAGITFDQGIPVIKKLISRIKKERISHFEISTFPVFNDSGKTIHSIVFTKDITDEKQMIEQVIRSEKLASIGNMTAGVAHEMNNPLSGISGNAANLLRMPQKYGLNEKGISRITTILNSAAHATAIMTDLLHLSQRPEQTSIMVNINALLVKTANAVHLDGSQEIERSFNLEEKLPPLQCDPSKIQQVIMHVVTNALQAILDQKRIVQKDTAYRGHIVLSTQKKSRQVLITIADNGVGIAEKHRSKVFDPFFSTRPTGQGTGLGLSVSTKIIEQHNGKIFFDTINEMTQFSILLPFQQEEPDLTDTFTK